VERGGRKIEGKTGKLLIKYFNFKIFYFQMIINDLDFSEFVEFEQDPLVMARMAQVAQDKGLLPGAPPPPPPPGIRI
jgi:hypothetical protein